MRLPRLALQTMLLFLVRRVVVATSTRMTLMLKDILLASLDLLFIHIIQQTHAQLDIIQELIAARLAEILSHDYAQHLEVFGIGCHGVSGDDPGSTAELVSECEFVVVMAFLGVEAEGYEGQPGAVLLGHDDESKLGERVGKVVCGAGEVRHDAAVTVLAETNELVVLADDLRRALGEVESEGCLVGS